MVTSIALREGTDWTSAFLVVFPLFAIYALFFCIGWITFAVAAVMQGCLLIMCCIWKIRQNKLGIDDFGNLVDPLIYPTINADEAHHHQEIVVAPYESTSEEG